MPILLPDIAVVHAALMSTRLLIVVLSVETVGEAVNITGVMVPDVNGVKVPIQTTVPLLPVERIVPVTLISQYVFPRLGGRVNGVANPTLPMRKKILMSVLVASVDNLNHPCTLIVLPTVSALAAIVALPTPVPTILAVDVELTSGVPAAVAEKMIGLDPLLKVPTRLSIT